MTPNSNVGGGNATLKVTLDGLAPQGNVAVKLASSDSVVLPVLSVLLVLSGQSTASMPVTIQPVDSAETVRIDAVLNGAQRSALVTLRPSPLKSVAPLLPAVVGGSNVTFTVTLTGKTGSLGRSVNLASNNAHLVVPASVFIGPGKTTATFTATTSAVGADTGATVTASSLGVTKTGTVKLTP